MFWFRKKKYIGKTILVGISVFSAEGELLDRFQYFGEIVSIGKDVIRIKTDEGDSRTIPPDLSAIEKAKKGIYTLKSSGRQIENPDFVSSWSITKAKEEGV